VCALGNNNNNNNNNNNKKNKNKNNKNQNKSKTAKPHHHHHHHHITMASRLYSHLLGSADDHVLSLTTIVTREPMMQYAIEFLNNLCLKQGVAVRVLASKPSEEFQEFFNKHFVAVLSSVLRYKLYCGFLPWVVYSHPVTGDSMPVLLPIGSFAWTVRTKSMFMKGSEQSHVGGVGGGDKKRKTMSGDAKSAPGSGKDNVNLDHSCVSEYVVTSRGDVGVDASDINVVNLIDPMLTSNSLSAVARDSGNNPCLGQAQYSPLYVPLQKYLALDLAQQRRCYADDWNTTARLVTTKTPPNVQNERAGRDEIPYGTTRFQQAQMPEGFFTYDNMKLQYQNTSTIVKDALEQPGGRGSEHVPAVYSLPAHYNLVQPPDLKPLQDIDMLDRQYRSAIAHCLGVPLHMIDADQGGKPGAASADELPFNSQLVKNTCEGLIVLMDKVLLHMYSTVYSEKREALVDTLPRSRVSFKFNVQEIYSADMKTREDEKTVLQKGAPPSSRGAASSSATARQS
jgi:hypothetical protein